MAELTGHFVLFLYAYCACVRASGVGRVPGGGRGCGNVLKGKLHTDVHTCAKQVWSLIP